MDAIELTRFPRMEWSKRWERLAVPLGEGWHDAMVALLQATRIPAAGERTGDRARWTGKGKSRRELVAKECAPGLAPYLLRAGDKRCKRDVMARDEWTHLPLDIDAVPVTVDTLLDIEHLALGDLRRVLWTTYSCRDGYASARVLLPLTRTVTLRELAALWWWARERLIKAGLPPHSAKAGEPSLDPRLDARLYYLPAVPTPMTPGTEGWGGVAPRGLVTPDATPLLDVDIILPEALRLQSEGEPTHLAQWPGKPLPGVDRRTRAVKSSVASASAGGEVERVDFGSIPFEGSDLRSWIVANLEPGTETSVGSPWRADGGSGTFGRSLRVHHEADGRLWAKDFGSGIAYLHEPAVRVGTPDPDAAARLRAEREEDRASGRMSAEVEFVEELGAALIEHPLVLREAERRATARRLDEISEELSVFSLKMSSAISPNKEDGVSGETPEDIFNEDIGASLDILGGPARIDCPRGPWAHRPAAGGYCSWQIPCKSSTCVTCGPWMRAARRAAAVVTLRRLARSGWSGAELGTAPGTSGTKAIRRWVEAAPGARAWLRARQPDGTERDLLLWAVPSDLPEAISAVGRLLRGGRSRPAPVLEGWAEEALSVAEAGEAGVRVLTGTEWLVSRIHGLRNGVIERKGEGTGPKTRCTLAAPSEVRDLIEREAGGVARAKRARQPGQRYTRHTIERPKGPPTEAEMEDVFERIGQQGTWKRPGRRKGGPIEDDPGIEWLDLETA